MIGDFAAAKVVDVAKLEQFLIGDAESLSAMVQGAQVALGLVARGVEGGFGQGVQQILIHVGRQFSVSQKTTDLDFRGLTSPGEEAAAGPEQVELAPEDCAHRLEQVVGVFPVPDDGKDVRVQFTLMACNQLGEQTMAILFVHQPVSTKPFQEARARTEITADAACPRLRDV